MPKLSKQVNIKPMRLFSMWKEYTAKDSEHKVGWILNSANVHATSLTPSGQSVINTLNKVSGGENLYWYVIPATRKGNRIGKKVQRSGVVNGLPCFVSPIEAMKYMRGRKRPMLNTPFSLLAVFEKQPKSTNKGLIFTKGMVVCIFNCSLVRTQQKAYTAMNAFRIGKKARTGRARTV